MARRQGVDNQARRRLLTLAGECSAAVSVLKLPDKSLHWKRFARRCAVRAMLLRRAAAPASIRHLPKIHRGVDSIAVS